MLLNILFIVRLNNQNQNPNSNNNNIDSSAIILGKATEDIVYNISQENISNTFKAINPKTYNIEINKSGFFPQEIKIKKGDSIIWVNKDREIHTVVSDEGNELNSDSIKTDKIYDHTFYNTGNYSYHCYFKPQLTGKVVVV